jgi:FPC/CPF motif-containing protein YcgG
VTELTKQHHGRARGSDEPLLSSLEQMVEHAAFPCVGAKAVFHQQRATLRFYDRLGAAAVTPALAADLREFSQSDRIEDSFVSFVAIFRGPSIMDEIHFERLLWSQLTGLARCSHTPRDSGVSDDPADPHFGFSLFGVAYFVVGLHPAASREARRAASPIMVFNPHKQFERLREEGRYERMRDVIRRRDRRLQGTINPMVGDFGLESEARQYSGRQVGPNWEPPVWVGPGGIDRP